MRGGLVSHETQSIDDVFHAVEDSLKEHQPNGYKLKVVREGSKQDDDWWYVLVQPDKDGISAFDYASKLAEMETELQEIKHLKVLLVPVLPE
jgi:hypothetical protein